MEQPMLTPDELERLQWELLKTSPQMDQHGQPLPPRHHLRHAILYGQYNASIEELRELHCEFVRQENKPAQLAVEALIAGMEASHHNQ